MRACEPRKAACTRPTELLVLTVGIRSVGESDRYPVVKKMGSGSFLATRKVDSRRVVVSAANPTIKPGAQRTPPLPITHTYLPPHKAADVV